VTNPTCAPCLERIPEFAAYAAASGLPRQDVLAVLIGTGEETAEIAERLDEVARLVIEPVQGPVGTAFSVVGYPAMGLLDDRGWIRVSGGDLTAFPTPVPARG